METIKKNNDFRLNYSLKNSKANSLLVLYLRENNLEISRLGVSISKKVGKAHVRNKIKRQIKEIIRLNEDKIKLGYDLVFVVRVKAKDKSYQELECSLLKLLEVQGLIK